jgi:FixJ family two-component response regulator
MGGHYSRRVESRCRPICVNSQAGLHARYELLMPREREVMRLVVKGLLNNQVAGEPEIDNY